MARQLNEYQKYKANEYRKYKLDCVDVKVFLKKVLWSIHYFTQALLTTSSLYYILSSYRNPQQIYWVLFVYTFFKTSEFSLPSSLSIHWRRRSQILSLTLNESKATDKCVLIRVSHIRSCLSLTVHVHVQANHWQYMIPNIIVCGKL